MSFVVDETEIITGERLQAIADVAVVTPWKRALHPSIPRMPLALFADDLALNDAAVAAVRSAKVIFVYSDYIDFFFDRLLPLLDRPAVLITNGGDHQVGAPYRPRIDTEKLSHWFALNAAFAHPKITAIPIGLANAHWPHGDTAALAGIAARPHRRRSGLYVNFEVSTNPAVRAPLLSAMQKNPFAVMARKPAWSATLRDYLAKMLGGGRGQVPRQAPALPYAEYLAELASWEFCISPPGNGLDCHRTWEAMYLGVWPVVSMAPVGLLDRLPCIFVDDLRTVTREALYAKAGSLTGPFEYERLTVSYRRRRILSRAPAGST